MLFRYGAVERVVAAAGAERDPQGAARRRESALADPGERILGRVLRRQAEANPEQPYLRTAAGEWTSAEVDRSADAFAAGLHRLGVQSGDTVALLTTAPEQVPLTFGVNRLGAVWIPTNVEYRGQWLADSLAASRAEVLVADGSLLGEVARLAPDGELPFRHVVAIGEAAGQLGGGAATHDLAELAELGADRSYPEPAAHYGDTVAVLWTSGTTGRAKGVMQSHHAFVRAALTGAASSATAEDDVLYCCLPLHNSAGWVGVVYRALVSGVPFALDARFSVTDFWDRTRLLGATQAFTLGAMHLFLWQAPERPDDADNPVRAMGAIPMPDAILEPFKRRFGIEVIQQGYGQSEVMGLVSRVDDGRTHWNPGSCGRPMRGVEVALLDDDDRPVPVGEAGEFCVRPTEPHVLFNGYFDDPGATVAAWRNLWYHTGDLGRQDEDGQYFFVDRKRDLVRFMGRSVSSFAVESVVASHPAVAEVAAYGVALDELTSECELMVAVVRRPGESVGAGELAGFVAERAPKFMVPRYVEFRDELPKTPTGKVQKYLLRQQGAGGATWDRLAPAEAVRG